MHILIVDDEPLAQQRLNKLITRLDGYEVVGIAGNGEQAVEAVESLDPDIVLMDVQMPGKDGLAAAKEISQLNEPPAIIFCTAYDDYAIKAFDAQAVGYLVKPVSSEQLHDVLEKAQRTNKLQRAALREAPRQNTERRKNIPAKTRKGVELIPVDEIYCFIADQKYVTVFYENGETLIDDTLKELEAELAPDFVRVHRNALVAVKNITGLEKTDSGQFEVMLRDCDVRPMVSRRHMSSIKSLVTRL